MSDEYASSGFKGSLVNPCTCSHPPQYSSSNTSLPLLHSHQRHTTPPPTRVLSTLFRLRNEELPPARRQYVPILDSPYIDARSRAFTPVFFLATSSGGRRTGPPDSAGFAGPTIEQSQSPKPSRGREQHRDAESLDTRKEAADALAARYRASRERLGGVGE